MVKSDPALEYKTIHGHRIQWDSTHPSQKYGYFHKERRNTMGDKGGKKDKEKSQKQKASKEAKKKKDKK